MNGITIIDDFWRRHPTAIRETLAELANAIRNLTLGGLSRDRNPHVGPSFSMNCPNALLTPTVSFFRVSRASSKFPKGKDSTPNAWSQISSLQESRPSTNPQRSTSSINLHLAQPGDVVVVFSNGGF